MLGRASAAQAREAGGFLCSTALRRCQAAIWGQPNGCLSLSWRNQSSLSKVLEGAVRAGCWLTALAVSPARVPYKAGGSESHPSCHGNSQTSAQSWRKGLEGWGKEMSTDVSSQPSSVLLRGKGGRCRGMGRRGGERGDAGSRTGSGPWDALGSAQGEPGDGCWMHGHVHSSSMLIAAIVVLGERQLRARGSVSFLPEL